MVDPIVGPIGRSFSIDAEESVHSWYVFGLVRRTVVAPSGERFERTYLSTPGAVGIVAVTDEGSVLLVRQYRATLHESILEIPAGMRDKPGEAAEVTAERELHEETGFTARSLTRLGSIISSPGVTDSIVEIHLAEGLTRGAPVPHGPEEQEMELLEVPFEIALSMVDDGRITDSKTVAGLLLTARLRPDLLTRTR